MMKHFRKIFIFTLIVSVFAACLREDENEKIFSDDASFVSLRFEKNDSIPFLETAVFTLEYDLEFDDSIIVNLDSLPFQTRIDSVYPNFTFKSTSGAFIIMDDSLGTGFDTIVVTGKDTLDFTRVKSITNHSSSRKYDPVTYPIKVNVHQVEPELYVWRERQLRLYTHAGEIQYAIYHNDNYLYFVNSASSQYVYTSSDVKNWTVNIISDLPSGINFRDIVVFDNKLFLAHDDGKIYESADGTSWIVKDPAVASYTVENLLFALEGNLWGIFKNDVDGKHYFAQTADGNTWQIKEEIPANFPVADYAAISFASRTKKPKALTLGGFSADGELLNTVWTVQKNVENAYKWIDLNKSSKSIKALSGAKIINYDDKLLLFGGVDADGEMISEGYLMSKDEGLNWLVPDSALNYMIDIDKDVVYEPRAYQSVIHNPETHYIYLFGGKSPYGNSTLTHYDLWEGKLNRLSFLRK